MKDGMDPSWRMGTRAVHAGRPIDPQTGAVVPPVHLATTFARDSEAGLPDEFLYSRYQNPNRRSLEICLTELEGAAATACFASGSAVANAVLQCLDPGDRVVYSEDLYHGVRLLMEDLAPRTGLVGVATDLSDLRAAEEAIAGGARVVWCETPTNPRLLISDVRSLAAMAHEQGALLLIDNTFATPALQRPLALGADLVAHSTTKYLAGHSDVVGGALVTADPTTSFWQRVQNLQRLAGAVPAPFDCWLALRGISTLVLRMKAHEANATELASWLHEHPRIDRVFYPGLESHPGHDVAKTQMDGFGGMVSFLVSGGYEGAAAFASGLRLLHRATSLGGVHTLIEHRALVEPPSSPVPRNLIRLSVGIEDVDDLREDLDRALGQV